jgi:NAD(P)-dependent dehydrogenase (short-subunit alcohol dehydrogenase family)
MATTSAKMGDAAAREASFPGMIAKQVFHSVPKIPKDVTLKGKTAIVTGASGGLGLECGRQFLQLGLQKLILAVRSQSKGDAAAKKLLDEHPKADVEVWILDMESYDSVRSFASRCETLDRLDVVILNAGCGRQTYRRCEGPGGREVTLQVNYLATVLLTILLTPIVKRKSKGIAKGQTSAAPGRITIVGSDMAYWAKLDESPDNIIDMVDSEQGFDGMAQYAMSKLLIPMFLSKFAPLVNPDDVVVNVMNPSAVRGTELMRDSKGQWLTIAFVSLSNMLMGRNLVDGTRQYVHSAVVIGKECHGSWTDFKIRPYVSG